MGRDREAFRKRFLAYKNGKSVSEIYDAGLPRYAEGRSPWDDSVDFIKKYESWSDTTYQKKGDKSTIGWGTTNPKWVSKGRITKDQGRIAMAEDLALGEPLLRKNIKNYDKFPDSAKTVLRDILYNVGQGNLFNKSPKFMRAINSGNYAEAARQMDWDNNKPGMGGAMKRNAARQELFLRDLQNNPVVQESELVLQMKQTPLFLPWENYHGTDYPINNPAPASISSWNSPWSPAYTPALLLGSKVFFRLPNIREVIEQQMLKPAFKNGKLPGYEDGIVPEPVQAAKSAIDFANLYYNSPGFNERFRRVTSDANGFLNSLYNPTASYWEEDDLWDNKAKMSWNIKRTPLKIGKIHPIPEPNAKYDPLTGNVLWGDSSTPSVVGMDWNTIMAHEIGHALDSAIKVNNSMLGDALHSKSGKYGFKYSNLHPILRKSLSYQKMRDSMDDAGAKEYDKYPNSVSGWFGMSNIPHDARPEESYADLFAMRKLLYDLNIFDSTKSGIKFTKDHLNTFKKKNKSRLFDNFSDEDIIWMINNIANSNSDKKLSPIQREV